MKEKGRVQRISVTLPTTTLGLKEKGEFKELANFQ
jgi:hypothetical protein